MSGAYAAAIEPSARSARGTYGVYVPDDDDDDDDDDGKSGGGSGGGGGCVAGAVRRRLVECTGVVDDLIAVCALMPAAPRQGAGDEPMLMTDAVLESLRTTAQVARSVLGRVGVEGRILPRESTARVVQYCLTVQPRSTLGTFGCFGVHGAWVVGKTGWSVGR